MKTIDTNSKLWVHLSMKKSSPFPIIIIVLVFLIIPIIFWFVTFKDDSDDIQGAKTEASGLVVDIKSEDGAWDMYKYLCKDRDECLESLTSGKALGKTSGGGGDSQIVNLRHSVDWNQYEFLKIFIKSGWGSTDRDFFISLKEEIEGSYIEKIAEGDRRYDTVLIPVDILENSVIESLTFTDR